MSGYAARLRPILEFGSLASYVALSAALRPSSGRTPFVPVLTATVCLILRGLLPGGFLRRFAAAVSAPVGSVPPLPARFRIARLALGTAFALVALLPLILPQSVEFDWGPPLTAAILLVFAAAELYAALAARGIFGPADTSGRRFAALDVVLLVLLPLYVVSIGNGALLRSGDNKATRLLGPLLVHERTLDLSRLPEFQRDPTHYAAIRVGERLLPSFPLGTGILTVPYALLASRSYGPDYPIEMVDRWEKHLSTLFLVASAGILFFALRGRWADGPAFETTCLFAFATTAFSCMGRALFSTTGEVFLLVLALLMLFPPGRGAAAAAGAGVALGGAFLCRPTALLPAAALGLWLFPPARRRLLPPFLSALAVSVGAVVALHLLLYHNVLGGYGLMNLTASRWGRTLGDGILGVLVSPSRGALIWFPYLLAVPLGFSAIRRDVDLQMLSAAAALSVAANLGLAAGFDKWWGGDSLGPRLTTEVAPFLALLTLPLWRSLGGLSRPSRALVLLLTGLAAGSQLLGSYSRTAIDWSNTVAVDRTTNSLWSIRNSQLLAAWWPGWYPSWKSPEIGETGGAAGSRPLGDEPVSGDFDGDGKADITVVRAANGSLTWYILTSGSGYVSYDTVQWGLAGDLPVPADYDGDGKTDIAVFAPSTGMWHIRRSSDGETVSRQWGFSGDVPQPADYDGDGKADIAVYRPSDGKWYVVRSSDGAVITRSWGSPEASR